MIFETDVDRHDFPKTLAEACESRRGWCFGPPEFKASLPKQIEGRRGEHHSGQ